MEQYRIFAAVRLAVEVEGEVFFSPRFPAAQMDRATLERSAAGGADVFDFAPSRENRLAGLRPIDDLWVSAIYFNNLGAEALLEGITGRQP